MYLFTNPTSLPLKLSHWVFILRFSPAFEKFRGRPPRENPPLGTEAMPLRALTRGCSFRPLWLTERIGNCRANAMVVPTGWSIYDAIYIYSVNWRYTGFLNGLRGCAMLSKHV